MSNQDTATQYRWAAEDLEIDLKEQQRELRGAEAIRASEQAQLQRLQSQRQLAILPEERARLDNSIKLAQRRVEKSNSEVEQIGQKVQQTQQEITYNRNKESEALGGPPAANNVPPPGPVATQQPDPTPLNATQQAAQPPLATPVEPSPAPVTPAQRGDNGGFVTNAQGELIPSDSEEAEEIRAEQNRVEAERATPQREFVVDPNTNELVPADSAQAEAIRAEQNRVQTRAPVSAIEEGGEAEAQAELARINRPIDDPTGVLAAEDAAIAEQEALQGDADAFSGLSTAPAPVQPNLTQAWDPETGSYGVWDEDKGQFVETGLTEEEATRAAGDPFEAERLAREKEFEQENPPDLVNEPAPVPDVKYDEFGNVVPNTPEEIAAAEAKTAEQRAAEEQAAAKLKAINQATLQSLYKAVGSTDWRVRLQLAPSSNYLYNAGNDGRLDGSAAGILAPLIATNGVIFPYTPTIDTSYRANYEQYDLIHSNYRGIYYKNSRVDDLNIRAQFTAQDTNEANYLLAVIHFFRSVTKMFYGKDAQRGSPPPLVFLSGLGPNQFNDHPCVVSSFQYNLPNNVDYIRATSVNNYGTDLLSRRNANTPSSTAGLGAVGNRIKNSPALQKFFGQTNKPNPDSVVGSVNNSQLANYVPTMMEINITLIPVQTRSQVSKQFSLKGFANGDLIKGGFW